MLSFPPRTLHLAKRRRFRVKQASVTGAFPTSYPHLEEQLNGIKWRDGKRTVDDDDDEEEEEEEVERKERRKKGKRRWGYTGLVSDVN